MPCYDGRDNHHDYHSCEETRKNDIKSRQELLGKISEINGALCAVVNELDRRGIASDVLSEACRNGLIDLMEWWSNHKKSDEVRLAVDIHSRYSKDEQKVLRGILNKETDK